VLLLSRKSLNRFAKEQVLRRRKIVADKKARKEKAKKALRSGTDKVRGGISKGAEVAVTYIKDGSASYGVKSRPKKSRSFGKGAGKLAKAQKGGKLNW